MNISEKGIELIQELEGYSPSYYLDVAGNPTIGYGHLIAPGEFQPGDEITNEEATSLLIADVHSAINAVRSCIVMAVRQNEFDALVSLAYNIGNTAFCNSTVVDRVNAGMSNEAIIDSWKWWNKITDANGNKVTSPGLVARREKETDFFATGILPSEKKN